MLSPYRVLDLSNERGLLCGQILADLGADVIAVEPPEGSPARRLGPFAGDVPHPDRSLFWWSYSRNKRSITLDLESPDGRNVLRKLLSTAHFFIESEKPGTLAGKGLGYTDLAAVNPALVYVSITPFGQTGPKAGYADSDLVVLASSGPLVLTGDDDRPPVRLSLPQAYLHASAEAAAAALIAHHERQRSGLGQHVDVSAQQAVASATQSAILANAVGFFDLKRFGGGARFGPLTVRFNYPARDGFVSITHVFGSGFAPFTRRLMEYAYNEGWCDAATRDKDWAAYTDQLFSGQEPLEEFERVKQVVEALTRSKTKAELFEAAQQRALLLAPVVTIAEVAASPQLAARRFWYDLEHPELGRAVRYPGPFARCRRTPIEYRHRPPTIGEHTAEILTEVRALPEHGPPVIEAREGIATGGTRPLEDVKVLDLMWAIAGPTVTRTLADYGATVVRVETAKRLDFCRTLGPFVTMPPGIEDSAQFHNMNVGKRMLTLDLTKRASRDVFIDLVRWADVVAESFAPGAMHALGFDYEALRQVKPEIIMLSTCLMGQTGPIASFAGFGNLAAAVVGFTQLCGWPDRSPAGPYGAYTDYIAPRFSIATLLAALDYRRRTGKGQWIDLSQAEASLHFLAPALLDYAVNGRVADRVGNRDPNLAPHGVYPIQGEDRWIALAVTTDAQWNAFCVVLGRHDLRSDARFAALSGRLQHAGALDAEIGATTASRDGAELEGALQAAGIPASVVLDSAGLVHDPQLQAREHFVRLRHPTHGTTTVENSRFRLSRTPAQIDRETPTLGRDNHHVLHTLLGYSDERITELVIAEAIK